MSSSWISWCGSLRPSAASISMKASSGTRSPAARAELADDELGRQRAPPLRGGAELDDVERAVVGLDDRRDRTALAQRGHVARGQEVTERRRGGEDGAGRRGAGRRTSRDGRFCPTGGRRHSASMLSIFGSRSRMSPRDPQLPGLVVTTRGVPPAGQVAEDRPRGAGDPSVLHGGEPAGDHPREVLHAPAPRARTRTPADWPLSGRACAPRATATTMSPARARPMTAPSLTLAGLAVAAVAVACAAARTRGPRPPAAGGVTVTPLDVRRVGVAGPAQRRRRGDRRPRHRPDHADRAASTAARARGPLWSHPGIGPTLARRRERLDQPRRRQGLAGAAVRLGGDRRPGVAAAQDVRRRAVHRPGARRHGRAALRRRSRVRRCACGGRSRSIAAAPILTVDTAYEKVAGAPVRVGVWTITQLTSPERLFLRLPARSAFPGRLRAAAPRPRPRRWRSRGGSCRSRAIRPPRRCS